jgi:hypothetical protein
MQTVFDNFLAGLNGPFQTDFFLIVGFVVAYIFILYGFDFVVSLMQRAITAITHGEGE